MSKENKFRLLDVVTISVGHFVHDVFSSFLAPILPLLIEKLRMSYSIAGLLTLTQRLPALLNPLIGLFADSVSARYLLVFAPLVTSVAMSLLGLATNYIYLFGLLLIMGIGASMFHVPGPVVIRKVAGNRIGKGMSFFMFGGEVARSVGPLVILSAVSLWGLEGTYRLIPLGAFASFVLYLRLKNMSLTTITPKKSNNFKVKQTLKEIAPLFLTIGGATFFIALMKGAMAAFLPTFITHRGESLWAGGIALTSFQIAGAIGSFLSGTYSDKLGRVRILIVVASVSPALMLAFNFVPHSYSIPLLLLLGLFLFGSTPVILAIVNDNSSAIPSFINGIYITLNFGISGGAVFLFGLLGDLIGLSAAFKIVSFSSLFSIPFILYLKKFNVEKKKD